MIKSMQQCRDFASIIFNGIEINPIEDEDKQSLLIKWLLCNHKMDGNTVFHIDKEDGVYCGMIEVNDVMSLGFTLQKTMIAFHLLPPEPEMKRIGLEDWCSIWLYDIRIQTSIAILIRLINKEFPSFVNKTNKIE
jgi:hypothetical protein